MSRVKVVEQSEIKNWSEKLRVTWIVYVHTCEQCVVTNVTRRLQASELLLSPRFRPWFFLRLKYRVFNERALEAAVDGFRREYPNSYRFCDDYSATQSLPCDMGCIT